MTDFSEMVRRSRESLRQEVDALAEQHRIQREVAAQEARRVNPLIARGSEKYAKTVSEVIGLLRNARIEQDASDNFGSFWYMRSYAKGRLTKYGIGIYNASDTRWRNDSFDIYNSSSDVPLRVAGLTEYDGINSTIKDSMLRNLYYNDNTDKLYLINGSIN